MSSLIAIWTEPSLTRAWISRHPGPRTTIGVPSPRTASSASSRQVFPSKSRRAFVFPIRVDHPAARMTGVNSFGSGTTLPYHQYPLFRFQKVEVVGETPAVADGERVA